MSAHPAARQKPYGMDDNDALLRIETENEMDEVSNIPIKDVIRSLLSKKCRDFLHRSKIDKKYADLNGSFRWWDDDERSPFQSLSCIREDDLTASASAEESWGAVDALRKEKEQEDERDSFVRSGIDMSSRDPTFYIPISKRSNTSWYFDDGFSHNEEEIRKLRFRDSFFMNTNFKRYLSENDNRMGVDSIVVSPDEESEQSEPTDDRDTDRDSITARCLQEEKDDNDLLDDVTLSFKKFASLMYF